jgi:hypothetical protein
LFGYTKRKYYPFNVYSNVFVPNAESTVNNDADNTLNYVNNSFYILDTTTNYFDVKIYQAESLKMKVTSYPQDPTTTQELFKFRVTLFPDTIVDGSNKYSYSGTEIFNELNMQLSRHPCIVQNYDTSKNIIPLSIRVLKFGDRDYAFELSIRPNRRNTSNQLNQKMVVVFPAETNKGYINTVWTGSSSLFNFPEKIMELQNIRGEYNSYTTSYIINSSPYILLRCIANGYYTNTTVNGISGTYIATDHSGTAVDINDYKIDIPNSPTSGYILNQYYTAIQDSFNHLQNITNGQIKGDVINTHDPNYNTSFAFNINKVITTDKFYVDTSGSFLNTLLGFNIDLSGGVLHESNTETGTDIITINLSNNTFKIKPINPSNNETKAFLVCNVAIQPGAYTIDKLTDEINRVFNTYNNNNISLSNSSINYNIVQGQKKYLYINLNIQGILKNKDYALYFFDTDSIAKSIGGPTDNQVWYNAYRYNSDVSVVGGFANKPYYYKWRDGNGNFVATNSWGNSFGFQNFSYPLADGNGNPLAVTGTLTNQSNLLSVNNTNNFFDLIPIYNPAGGAYNTRPDADSSSNNAVRITLDLPIGEHTKEEVSDSINKAFYNNPITRGSYVDTTTPNTLIRLNINKVFTAKDYSLVFYDVNTFTQCNYGSHSSAQVTTADTTLGWKMGFRSDIAYNTTPANLSNDLQNGTTYYGEYIANAYTYDENTNIATLTGDTSVNVNLYNYFLIILDDYTQNHLNDGLITTTIGDTDIPLPSYANKASRKCIVATDDEGVSNTTSNNNFNQLTNAQIYSANQILNTKATKYTKNVFSSGPFVQDIFGMIPVKTAGLSYGQTYSEFGGTLQIQERIYFGPVNISRMTVRIMTDKGNVLDLNNQNWSFSLITEQLYNPNKG